MALLRVADYLQIQPSRANEIVFQYRHIPSKQSELEWKAHNAILNITQTHDDPESIEIQAAPKDVDTYLRLKDWLAGIQTELDASWAVLGETYGLHPNLCKLGLILRRVRSNLDDAAGFAQTVEYVPQRIDLAVARPDLLKLLVGPLYDNTPSIGIRELMQNAIDAIREREVLQERHPELRNAPLIEQTFDVEIHLCPPDKKGISELIVRDRGVGMTLETIRDYFLTAGASYRNSDAWKREFEIDDTPHSRVLRSGRFGVGVLAGFLLGPRMEVTTRHIRASRGIRFSTTMDLHAIELRHNSEAQVGTEIRIPISAATRQTLIESGGRVSVPEKFDWFAYDRPTIGRFIDGLTLSKRSQRRRLGTPADQQSNPGLLSQQYAVPQPTPLLPSSLRLLRGDQGFSVYWTYRPLPALAVNGIFVTESSTRSRFSSDTPFARWNSGTSNDGLPYEVRFPRICIEDADGTFPLNVRRSGITDAKYSFESQLITDIIDDYLAYLLVRCPTSATSPKIRWAEKHPGIFIRTAFKSAMFDFDLSPMFRAQAGTAILSPRLRRQLGAKVIYLIFSAPDEFPTTDVCGQDAIVVHAASTKASTWPAGILKADIPFLAALDLGRTAQSKTPPYYYGYDRGSIDQILLSDDKVSGFRCIFPSRVAAKVNQPETLIDEAIQDYKQAVATREQSEKAVANIRKDLRDLCARFVVERSLGEHVSLVTRNCPPTRLPKQFGQLTGTNERCVVEIFLTGDSGDCHKDDHEWDGKPGLITRRWTELIPHVLIPFDLVTRKRELAHTYEVLAPFIRAHEAMMQEGVLH